MIWENHHVSQIKTSIRNWSIPTAESWSVPTQESDKENLFGIFLGVTHDIILAELNIIVAINHPLASWLSQ